MKEIEIAKLVDRAFEYRGNVTVRQKDGRKLVGYLYDRTPLHVEMFDEKAENRIRLPMAEIAGIDFSGEDTAAKAQRIWEKRKGALEPPQTSPWGEWGERPVLFVTAMPVELGIVARALGGSGRSKLGVGVAVGMGGGSAAAVDAERPRLVVSCGFAGALDPSLKTGDLVLASSVVDETGESIAASEAPLSAARRALSAREGEIFCATQVAASGAEKRALARPGRLAVDLETWAAARAAQRLGLPWLALRVVLDGVDDDLPAFTRESHESYVVPALKHALGGPRKIADLARLGMKARTAGQSLERALAKLALALEASK